MLTITSEQFALKIKQHKDDLNFLIKYELPIIIGKESVSHFKKNFQNESWERTKWKEVKRRSEGWARGAAKTRKILTGETGDLGRSLEYTEAYGQVTISSDLIYAAVHNFGLKAGRGKGFKMSKRKFIGDSNELTVKITKIINARIEKILSK